MKPFYSKNIERIKAYIRESALDHITMDIFSVMRAVYGGWPVNIHYDPYRKVYLCDIIKVEEDDRGNTEEL